jgi:dihydroorotate dehydrogenase (fumarate)
MVTLFPNIEHAGPQEYLHNLQKAREVVSIPFIASLNAVFKESWVEYAGLIEQTGVDGLELNFYNVPKDPDITGSAIEKQQLEILREVKKVVKIPVSVKLSFSYTSPLHFINELDKAGVDGVVLFNRFYQPDIDLGKLEHISEHNLSTSAENQIPMRFAGLLYSHLAAGICCSSGIHEGTDVIKMILSGADCVQVVSTIYMNKIHHITKMLNDIQNWMSQQGYKTLSDFKGRLARKNVQDPFVYQRAQYIDLLLKSGELFKKYTIR